MFCDILGAQKHSGRALPKKHYGTIAVKTGIVIERSDFLYLEREDKDGNIFYEEVPLYQDVERYVHI